MGAGRGGLVPCKNAPICFTLTGLRASCRNKFQQNRNHMRLEHVRRFVGLCVTLLVLAGCATPMPRKDAPYENFNRKMYAFNEFADRIAIRPVAMGYRKVTNQTTRTLISNFFANVESP